nr:sulfatase-like hydrolase/transferase [Puniceicoccus vermicola]
MIVTDQQRADSIGCYGNKHSSTPNLDALASEGTVCRRAYCTTPICTPARASLQTGLYPSLHGMQTNICTPGCLFHELPDSPVLLGNRMREHGYFTAYTGKWHLGFGGNAAEQSEFQKHMREYPLLRLSVGSGALPSTRGYEIGDDFPGHGGGGEKFPQFQEYLQANGLTYQLENKLTGMGRAATLASGKESSVSHYLTNRAIDCLEDASSRDQPFFLSLHFWGPHEPYYVPQEFLDLYDINSVPLWNAMSSMPQPSPRIHSGMRKAKGKDEDEIRTFLQHYYGFVSHIDDEVGRLVQALKRLGVYENTTIIFTADHGESLGSHGGMVDKGLSMFEETVRVPLIIKHSPNQIKDTHAFINTTDIYASILDIANCNEGIEQQGQGRSILPLLNGEAPVDWPDSVVVESSGIGHCLLSQRMIRNESWKYVLNVGDVDELYDMKNDPDESRNLIASDECYDARGYMKEKLLNWMERNEDPLLKRVKYLAN